MDDRDRDREVGEILTPPAALQQDIRTISNYVASALPSGHGYVLFVFDHESGVMALRSNVSRELLMANLKKLLKVEKKRQRKGERGGNW